MDIRSRVSHLACISLFFLITVAFSVQAQTRDEVVFFFNDAQGSAVAAVSEAGELCWHENYSPYGEKLVGDDVFNTEGCGIVGDERGFTSHAVDYDTDLVYMQQRYYDPTIGRFLSIDPASPVVGDPRTINRYAYTANNPINYIDPDGRSFLNFLRRDMHPQEALEISAMSNASLKSGLGGTALVATVITPGPEDLLLGGVGLNLTKAGKVADNVVKVPTKTVGRHMSPKELEKMRETGRVQEGGGGQTRVADPSNPNTYKNPPEGDVYVEFDVPADRVLPHSKGTGRIPGPNSPDARVPGRNPAGFEMPRACNITEC